MKSKCVSCRHSKMARMEIQTGRIDIDYESVDIDICEKGVFQTVKIMGYVPRYEGNLPVVKYCEMYQRKSK